MGNPEEGIIRPCFCHCFPTTIDRHCGGGVQGLTRSGMGTYHGVVGCWKQCQVKGVHSLRPPYHTITAHNQLLHPLNCRMGVHQDLTVPKDPQVKKKWIKSLCGIHTNKDLVKLPCSLWDCHMAPPIFGLKLYPFKKLLSILEGIYGK